MGDTSVKGGSIDGPTCKQLTKNLKRSLKSLSACNLGRMRGCHLGYLTEAPFLMERGIDLASTSADL